MKTPLHHLIDHLESYQSENNTDVISIDLLKRVIIDKFVSMDKTVEMLNFMQKYYKYVNISDQKKAIEIIDKLTFETVELDPEIKNALDGFSKINIGNKPKNNRFNND